MTSSSSSSLNCGLDSSEVSELSTGSVCRVNVAADDWDDDEDARCNWDVELLQFLVESFICMFPERKDERTIRPSDARGRIRAQRTNLFTKHASTLSRGDSDVSNSS